MVYHDLSYPYQLGWQRGRRIRRIRLHPGPNRWLTFYDYCGDGRRHGDESSLIERDAETCIVEREAMNNNNRDMLKVEVGESVLDSSSMYFSPDLEKTYYRFRNVCPFPPL